MIDSNKILPYLEFNLTDHCNLNCKGCTHFCPIADENYLTMDTFQRDMKRLSEIFANISKIRILGGEPLLHPLVAEFAEKTCQIFPDSEVFIVTNGILLPTMNSSFYETLQKNKVTLHISIYPITKEKISSYTLLAYQYKIPINFSIADHLGKMINATGDSDKHYIFKQCWAKSCTFLHYGKIYHCCMPALSYNINKKFGWNIPSDSCMDIHTNVSAEEILDFLSRPSSTCAYCTESTCFPWEVSKCKEDEWLV